MTIRIEVGTKEGLVDSTGEAVRSMISEELGITLDFVQVVYIYYIEKALSESHVKRCRDRLFTDPLTQDSTINRPFVRECDWLIEVGFLPGVTDNVGRTSKEAIEDLLGIRFNTKEAAYSSKRYLLKGDIGREDVLRIGKRLSNTLINSLYIRDFNTFAREGGMDVVLPRVSLPPNPRVDDVDLNLGDEGLMELGQKGIVEEVKEGRIIRRGPLALDFEFLKVIQDHFNSSGRCPTDLELESIAQTWSEHCKHNIFAARIDEVDSIYRTFIKAATERIRESLGEDDWCLSVFSDNSGVVKFNEDWNICYKVETHNSPSALDPYGGAITGIVGVNRDPMGTGMGAKLIVNMYGFCFGDPYYDKELPYRDPERRSPILHPRVIFEGVRLGVEHGGNKSGIPTPWGFINFDDRYMGKPLVFVGTVGIMPARIGGRPSVLKKARPGDLIVMAGGRVGKDGIHGATFSSEGLHAGSPMGAVQIGDPITQKKLLDAQLEARDLGLYNSVTDNGAGGLSCSVGEMARESNGCRVDLENVPVKYSGLRPYEIWISESQERMTYAVPSQKIEGFMDLMRRRDVEATVIGEFTDTGRCQVYFSGKRVMDVELDFLHDGLPQLKLHSSWDPPMHPEPDLSDDMDYNRTLTRMLGRLNICSKEYVVRQFDHEVQGGSVIKPLVGVRNDIHSDAAVIRPLLDTNEGLALSSGILPSYGDVDPYHMAACCIDTAVRNIVAVGADLDRIALLDNFCWCSSDEPERLGLLKRTASACYDYAVGFRTPFISGKDSMFNDFKGYDKDGNPIKISVPPTLLISSIGIVRDVGKCLTLEPGGEGELLYILGITGDELGGSEYYSMRGMEEGGRSYIGGNVPRVDVKKAYTLYKKICEARERGMLLSCHGLGPGGLVVGLAKMAMASGLGIDVELDKVPCEGRNNEYILLFSESQSRLLVTISPETRGIFEEFMEGTDFAMIGKVTNGRCLMIKGLKGKDIIDIDVEDMRKAYKKTLDW